MIAPMIDNSNTFAQIDIDLICKLGVAQWRLQYLKAIVKEMALGGSAEFIPSMVVELKVTL